MSWFEDEFGEDAAVNIAAIGVIPDGPKKPNFDDNIEEEDDY